ncbi:MAG: gliding motility-associated C-terminal domain-containing protein [Bacteroidales bacterium]|nr:gliding motility-associated C-terminal domain-containing protein [Bacteroidales bacterium]
MKGVRNLVLGCLYFNLLFSQTYTVSHFCSWSAHHQSMWGPNSNPFYLNIQQPLFNINYNDTITFGSIQNIFGLQFGALFTINPHLLLSSTFIVQGFHNGWVDVDYPVRIDLTFPMPYTFMPGDWLTINSKYYVQPGWNLSTQFPQDGIINLDLEYGFGIDAFATICFGGCTNYNFLNLGVPNDSISIININYQNGDITYPCMQNGQFTFCHDTILPIVFNDLFGTGLSGYITLPYVTTTDHLDTTNQCHKKIIAQGDSLYANFNLDIIQFLTAVATWLPDSSGQPLIDFINQLNGTINIGGGISITYQLLTANLLITNTLQQDFTFNPTIWNHFHMPVAVPYYVTDPTNNNAVVDSGYSNYIVWKACHDLHFKYPCFGYPQFTINYYHTLSNQFTNHTWDSVAFTLQVNAFEFWINLPFFKITNDSSNNNQLEIIPQSIPPIMLDSLKELVRLINLKTIPEKNYFNVDSLLSKLPDSILIDIANTRSTIHIGPLLSYSIPLGYLPITWFNQTWELEGMDDTCGYFHEVLYSLPEMSINLTGKKCFEDNTATYTVTVSHGRPPYTYQWSNGVVVTTTDTFNIQTGFGFGTQYVTVTDANGCSLVDSYTVTATNPQITYQFNVNNVSCYGFSNGSVTVIASGGTPGYTYQWSNGDNTQTADSLAAGTYVVTITDAIGCTTTATVNVSQPASYVSVYIDSIVSVACLGEATGAIYITPLGGTPGYTYLWSTGSMSQDLVNVVSGTYTLTIYDSQGCSLVQTYTIPQVPHCCIYPNAGPDKTVCGYITQFEGNQPAPGITAVWQLLSGPGNAIINLPGSPNSSVMVTQQGTYYFAWHHYSHVCDTLDTVAITFITQPQAQAGPSHVDVCGTSYNLNAQFSVNGSVGSWQLLPPQIGYFTPNNTLPNATFNIGSGYTSYYLVWTENNMGCISKDTIVLTFHEMPEPDVGPDLQTCGNSIQLHVNTTYPGHWFSTDPTAQFWPSDTSTTVTATIILTQNVVVDTFIFMAQSQYCTNYDTLLVYFAKTAHAEAGANQSVCGYVTNLHADTLGSIALTGYWTSSLPGVSIIYNGTDPLPWNPQVTISQNYFDTTDYVSVYFYWHVSSGPGCNDYDSVLVTFHKIPNAFAGHDTTVCGKHVFLNAHPSLNNSTGIWVQLNGPGNTTFANATQPQTMAYVSQYGTYNYIWTEMNAHMPACNDKDTVKIEFLIAPEPDAGLDQEVCGKFAYICATPGGGLQGHWSGPTGIAFYDGPPPTGQYNPAYADSPCTWVRWPSENDTIKLYWVEFNGICYGMDSVSIYFAALEPAIILNNPADSLVCGPSFSFLNAQQPVNGYGYWYDEVPNTTFSPSPFASTQVTATIGQGSDSYYGPHYFHWVTVNGNCRDTSPPLYVNFIKQPVANAGGNYWPGLFGTNSDIKTDTVCGLQYMMNAQPSVVGSTGTWYSIDQQNVYFASTGSYISHVANDSLYLICSACYSVFNPVKPYREFVWQEVNHGYCIDSDTLRLYFAPRPSGQFTATMPPCRYDSSMIIAHTWPLPNHVDYGITEFHWEYPGGTLSSVITDPLHSDTIYVSWNSGDQHTVSLFTVNKWNCYSGIVTVIVKEPDPFKPNKVLEHAKCGNCNGKIVLSPDYIDNQGNVHTNYYTFSWLDGFTPSDTMVRENLCPGIYSLVVHGESQSPDAAPGTICHDTISIYIADTGKVIAAFDTTSFNDDPIVPYTFQIINNSINGKKFSWRIYDENGNLVATYNGAMPIITINKEGCYKIVLVATSKEGCTDTASYAYLCVSKAPLLEVPNVFTPNNDGINDVFIVHGESIKEFNAIIYNRWGRKIYEWNDINKGWDGKIDGIEASDGVYYIVIKAKDRKNKIHNYEGYFHLLKEK